MRSHTGRSLVLVMMAVMTLSARTTNAQTDDGAEDAYRHLEGSVVRVETRYASIFEPPGAGSGVVIADDGLIATADHVLDGAVEVWVVYAGPERQSAEVVKRSAHQDLALVRIEGAKGLAPIERRDLPARPGECVRAVGNVMNRGIGIFQGIVSFSACDGACSTETGAILTDITTPPGLSGGALVACADHALVGIISFGVLALNSAAPTAGIIGAVPASELEGLLDDRKGCASGALQPADTSTTDTMWKARRC